jgi:Domain of unknown function (DUF4148)
MKVSSSLQEEMTMKFIPRIVIGALLAGWCTSYAFAEAAPRIYDPSKPLTRAEVKADLAEWRQAGFDPNDWIDYPCNALAAGRIVAQRRAAAAGSVVQ